MSIKVGESFPRILYDIFSKIKRPFGTIPLLNQLRNASFGPTPWILSSLKRTFTLPYSLSRHWVRATERMNRILTWFSFDAEKRFGTLWYALNVVMHKTKKSFTGVLNLGFKERMHHGGSKIMVVWNHFSHAGTIARRNNCTFDSGGVCVA